MAIKFLAIAALLAATVLTPIHARFGDGKVVKPAQVTTVIRGPEFLQGTAIAPYAKSLYGTGGDAYIWVYLIFVYLFSGLAFYFLYTHTLRVIRVRQDYLGHQCTITDRTIRLSGIPRDMRSEQAIKNHVEGMGIGTVDSVTICRDWKRLDDMMLQRDTILRKLEEAWTVYLSRRRIRQSLETLPYVQPDRSSTQLAAGADEEPLLNGHGHNSYNMKRPQITLRSISFRCCLPELTTRKLDAIDHYTMKLETLDAKIEKTRKQEFQALPLAFVTLNSVAAAVSVPRIILTQMRR